MIDVAIVGRQVSDATIRDIIIVNGYKPDRSP